MVNFFDVSEVSVESAQIEEVVKALLNAFRQGPLYAQEQSMATLGE